MTRTNTQYTAAGTQFQIPETDDDQYDRDNQLTAFQVAVEEHDHSTGRGKPVQGYAVGSVGTTHLADGAASDIKVGNRTIDQSLISTGHVGTLTQLFSWLANRLKAIMGTSNWFDNPAVSLATMAAHAARHAPTGADPISLTPFGVWTSLNDGSGSGLDADLIDGKNITVAASAPGSPNAGDLWIDTSA